MNTPRETKPAASWIPVIILAGVVMAGVAHGGCKKGGGSGGGDAANGGGGPPALGQLYLNTNAVINLMVGSTITLSATGVWTDGVSQPEPVTYTLTPPTPFASFPSAGLLRGDAVGQTTLTATSIATPSVQKQVLVNVVSVPPGPPVITLANFNPPPTPDGTVGVYYSRQVTKNGGIDPCIWSVVTGQLPPGLTLGTTNGVISGVPALDGTFGPFTLKVKDAVDAVGTHSGYSMTIAPAPSTSGSPNPSSSP